VTSSAGPVLNYEFHQGAAGPVLLLVHGFLSSGAQWAANIEGMKAFCSPVTVDLWGHGRSPSPDDPALYTPTGYFRQFERIREALGQDRWALCGASFGAGLTLQYALAHSDRVTRQVFTNSMSDLAWTPNQDEGREARAAAIEAGGKAGLVNMPFHPRFAKRLAPAVVEGLMADAERLDPRGIANAMRYTGHLLSAASRFGETSVPTLLINGLWERAFQKVRTDATKTLPGLEVVDLEGGHSINAEAPEAFNTALRTFLERS